MAVGVGRKGEIYLNDLIAYLVNYYHAAFRRWGTSC